MGEHKRKQADFALTWIPVEEIGPGGDTLAERRRHKAEHGIAQHCLVCQDPILTIADLGAVIYAERQRIDGPQGTSQPLCVRCVAKAPPRERALELLRPLMQRALAGSDEQSATVSQPPECAFLRDRDVERREGWRLAGEIITHLTKGSDSSQIENTLQELMPDLLFRVKRDPTVRWIGFWRQADKPFPRHALVMEDNGERPSQKPEPITWSPPFATEIAARRESHVTLFVRLDERGVVH